MISRVYIDNFRCFVNFEHKPARKELILGANGAGKSSFMDALLWIRQFVITGITLKDPAYGLILLQKTRWENRNSITFELESNLDDDTYRYRLELEPWGEPVAPRIAQEVVLLDSKPIFEFIKGEMHLFNDQFEKKVVYDFDWHRSGLGTIVERKDNTLLSKFKRWFAGLLCFRLNPFAMRARAEREELYPNVDLSNIASWYRHLVLADPKQNNRMLDSLRACWKDFGYLQLEPAGESVRLLTAEFTRNGGQSSRFLFNELSDGQRCLICLYTILHFVLAKGNTVLLDEPDNFISLAEVQPWLMAVSDVVQESRGQVFLISHHPEAINQWAPKTGVEFFRDRAGPVRVKEFETHPESNLSPSEIVARGWGSE